MSYEPVDRYEPKDAELLAGSMYVWLEDERVVFYDWDNDEGLSLSLEEWERALAWWERPGEDPAEK